MDRRIRAFGFMWIHIMLFARCKGDPLCHEQNHDSSEFRVSAGGYFTDNLTHDLCKQLCAEQKFLFVGLLLGEYCLCGNSIEDFVEVEIGSCNVRCSGNPEEVCGSNDTNLIYTMETTSIGTIDNITIAVDDRTFFTDERVQVDVVVDASTKVEVFVEFGDGSTHTFTEEPFTVEKYYRMPGEYVIHASVQDTTEVNPPIFNERVITVEEKSTIFEVVCPTVVKPEEQSGCSLIVSSGSLLTMNYETNDDVSDEFQLPDPYYASTGFPVPPLVDESSRIDISLNKVYLTHAKFKLEGRLLGFKYYVKDKGKFSLLVLTPKCDTGSYCEETSDCSSTCQAYNVRECKDGKALCSLIGRCFDAEDPSDCTPGYGTGLKYSVKHSFEVEEDSAGYKYFGVPNTDERLVREGDIIGFQTDGSSSLWCRNSTEAEIENGIEDVSDDKGIGVVHFMRAIVTEPVTLSLRYTYNKTGNYTVSVTITDSSSDQTETKYLPVQIPISNVSIEIDQANIVVGKEVSACIKANGSNINVLWDYFEKNEKEYLDGPVPEEGIFKNIPCLESGEYRLSVNLSNLWNSEYVSRQFQCFLPIGRNWTLSSDSPKSTPPGTVSFDLKFQGPVLPGFAVYAVDFGDDFVTDSKKITPTSDLWQTFSHDYNNEGNFTVSVNISNPVDFEIFELTIRIFEKMGNLSVAPFFVKGGSYPEDKSELKGRDKVDAPVHSTVYFENDIAGDVTYYKMKFDDGSFSKNYSESVISHLFSEVGEWNISFRAFNSHLDEHSNDVKLFVRILADVSDIHFNASTTDAEVDEDVKFRIALSRLDDFTCVVFDGGDNGRLLGFGNKDVCTLYYQEGQFKFVKKSYGGSSRKRRETIKADWEDDYIISILYNYAYGGEFPSSVDVFNSVSRKRKDLTVTVSDLEYQTPIVWIDRNSTDMEAPIECQRGYDCRYETTAIFRSNQSYLASHKWTAFLVSPDGHEEEVDITALKTHNCSAIRIVKRTLDIALYKLRYTLTVYAEDNSNLQSNKSTAEQEDEDTYEEDYYYRAARTNAEEEDDDFSVMYENLTVIGQRSVFSFLRVVPTPLVPMMVRGGASYVVRGWGQTVLLEPNTYTEDPDYPEDRNLTVIGQRSVFSYLRVVPTPLVPMMVRGGASYVVRGWGQTVLLEPNMYTEDPDYPEDRNYDITWFCLRSDLEESLTEKGEHDYEDGNPSAPITDRSTIKEEEYAGGCFGKGPGLMEIASSNYELQTNSFWTFDAVYKVIAVIKKDGKVTQTYINIEVIRDAPPSLRVMCDKKASCFPEVRGLFINPNAWVPLRVECLENCGNESAQYSWKIFASDLLTWERKEIGNWENHVSVDFDRLGLNQSLYLEHPDVNVFLVEVTQTIPDTDFPKGVSSLFLLVNHAPKNGKCRLSSQSGTALLDVFTIEFSDWEDEDGHEFADYSVYVKYGGESLRLSYGLKTKVDIVLPYGDLEIFCSVEDLVGATTILSTANLTTQLPTEEELEEYENERFFDKCLAEGKMSLASQIVIAKNSIIMEYKKRNNIGDFSDVGERAVDAKWREYLDLDGIDSSYFTPQAREEVREKLREDLERQMDREAKLKNEELKRLLRLPMEALPDAEVFGGALSAVAGNGPTDFSGKVKIMRGLDSMFEVINGTDVPHPEDKKIVFSQFGNLADTIAGSLAESNIGGNFLPFELKQAEEVLDYNATEPNYFIFYIEGNRSEVERNLKERAIDAAKEGHMDEAKGMVTKIKEMVSAIQMNSMEEIMVGEEPFYTNTRSGFQMTFFKNYASNLSGSTIEQGSSSVVLPDLCKVLNIDRCEESDVAIGIQSVRWTQPLESYGSESSKLGEHSNVIQIELTPREGNTTIPVQNSSEPFMICMPVSSNGNPKMEYVIPSFARSDDILVYHTVTVDSAGTAATVNIRPDDANAPLVVLYSYGELPSLVEYDYISRIQDVPSSDGTFSLFIGSWVIRESGKNLSVGIGHAANTTDLDLFFDNPGKYNLSVVNMTNQFSTNYAIEILTTGCYYFSDSEEKWSTKGCKVVESKSDSTCCECNHLTSFGSGFFVTPNDINFSYVFAHSDFKTNVTIYATLIVTFSIFVLLLIYARWKDRKDLQKLGATPLPDNEASDKYIYEILIYTGHQRNAGTKSNVYFIVSGEDDETEVRHLGDDKRPILQKGSIDVFVMSVPRSLGQLNYLRIWHDNSGTGKWSSWYCQYIVFRDVQTGYKYEFLLNKWLAVEHDDGMIDRLVPVAGREQVTEFSHLFSTASRKNLADSHLWFSVFLRPPRSRFTRLQRTCCCMATVCLSMLANAMYYERTGAKPASGGFQFGPLSLSPEQIGVGLITNFLIFPPTFLMIFFFRKSRPRTLRPSRIESALNRQRAEWKKKQQLPPQPSLKHQRKSDAESGGRLPPPRKRKFSLPWWCVGFGWVLVAVSIVASLFFLWAYGISFGDERTSKWLSSLLVAFVSSVLVTQPLKILLMAIVVSCLCKSMDYEEDDSDEDEEDPHLLQDEEYLHDQRRTGSRGAAYRPMDTGALEEARREREKEVKMYSVLREISAYFLFLWVITILSYGNRDPNNFFLREALVNGFVKPGDLWVDYNNVNTERRFWNWTYNALIPELFALPWYNGNDPLGLRLYLDDRNNLKIGYAVLRQVRIQPRNCEVSWLIESITPECAGFGKMAFEDGTLYTKGWRGVNSSGTLVPPEYKYLTAAQLRGYPFWGQLDWYGGGGYVVPLVARRDSGVRSLIRRVERLEKDGWIDRHTRAVFVEFGVYNAQINLFCAVTILAEFLPGGGVVPYYHIDPLRLLNYHTGFGFFQLAIEVTFVVFTIFFTVRELKSVCREGRSYFGQYWNVAELVSIAVSYTGIANHVYKMFVTAEILRVFTTTEGTGYVKLQEAVLLNELFCYQIGLVMSISTLKFLKLLRFNKRIGILSSTLRMCAKELKSYSVCLLVVFTAFVALFWLLLGRSVRAFSTFASSFESSISMMLKKFDYDAMYAAQPLLAPVAFFTFSLATALVLVNILLSIIIRSFEEVKHDEGMQGNEYEILDFFVNRVKTLTGCGKGTKVRPAPSMYRDKKDAPKDSVSSFPAKVDRLVDFINDFYFDNQMDFGGKELLKKMETGKLEAKKAKPVMANKSRIPKSVAGRFDDF